MRGTRGTHRAPRAPYAGHVARLLAMLALTGALFYVDAEVAEAKPRKVKVYCYADGPRPLPHEDVACYPYRIKHPERYDVHRVRAPR